jgi:hypothetical protein
VVFRVYRCRYFLYRNIKGNNMQPKIKRKQLFSIGFLSILGTTLIATPFFDIFIPTLIFINHIARFIIAPPIQAYY